MSKRNEGNEEIKVKTKKSRTSMVEKRAYGPQSRNKIRATETPSGFSTSLSE